MVISFLGLVDICKNHSQDHLFLSEQISIKVDISISENTSPAGTIPGLEIGSGLLV